MSYDTKCTECGTPARTITQITDDGHAVLLTHEGGRTLITFKATVPSETPYDGLYAWKRVAPDGWVCTSATVHKMLRDESYAEVQRKALALMFDAVGSVDVHQAPLPSA